MSLLGAVASLPAVRAELARKAAAASARDRMAAQVITDSAMQGNPAAGAFVDEAGGLLQRARVHRSRARRLRSASARAAAMGYDRLASLGADVAAAEDAAGDSSEAAVVRAVRDAHSGAFGFVSDAEARIIRNSDWLAQATAGEAEAAFSAMLDRLASSGSNFGSDDGEESEGDAAERLGVALEVFGGDFPVIFGYDAYARIGAVFQASVATLQKRLRNKEIELRKTSDKLDSLEEQGKENLNAKMLRAKIGRLERSIARIRQKLEARGALKKQVVESKSASEDTEESESAAVESDSSTPAGSEVAPMSVKEKRLLANQEALSRMTASQVEAAMQKISEDASSDNMGADAQPTASRKVAMKNAGRLARAVLTAGGTEFVRAIRRGDGSKAKAALARRQAGLARRVGKIQARRLAGEVAVAFGLLPSMGADVPSYAGDALDITLAGGASLAKAASEGKILPVRQAIRRYKAREAAHKAAVAGRALRGESGTVFGGLPVVAMHGKSRPIFLGYFSRRAQQLGGDGVDADSEEAFGGFFDSIANWFRTLFAKTREESLKVERGLAARKAARAQFEPALADRRKSLRNLRADRSREVADVRLRFNRPVTEADKDVAQVMTARRKAGRLAYKTGRKGGQAAPVDLPAVMAPVAEAASAESATVEIAPASRTVEGKGGWVYEQGPDMIRIVRAPKGHEKAEGKLLKPNNRYYKAIIKEIGELSSGSGARLGASAKTGPAERFVRAQPQDRVALLARGVDQLLREGADQFRVERQKERARQARADAEVPDEDDDVIEEDDAASDEAM